MARKRNTYNTALVQIYERPYPNNRVRFYLTFTIDKLKGQQKELIDTIPMVSKSDKLKYREARQMADKIAAERIEQIRKKELGFANQYESLLLLDWCDTYIERVKSRVRSERYPSMVASVKDVIKEYSGENTRLQIVDRNYVIGFINYVKNVYKIKAGAQHRGERLKPSTAQKKCVIFSSILQEAVKCDILRKNPFNEIDRADKIKVPSSDSRGLTVDEIKRLIDTPTKSDKTKQIFLFMCFCGLRISDALKLKWTELNLNGQPPTMKIRQKKTEKLLVVPLSENAIKYLPEQTKDSEFVFYNWLGEQPMNRSLKKWAKKAGITDPDNLHLHSARHTFGSMLANSGVDVTITAELMGDDVRTVAKYYIHIADDTKVRAVKLLDSVFAARI